MKIYAILLSLILVVGSGGYIYLLKQDIKRLESDLSVCESKIPATEFKSTWKTKFDEFNINNVEPISTEPISKSKGDGYFEEVIK